MQRKFGNVGECWGVGVLRGVGITEEVGECWGLLRRLG